MQTFIFLESVDQSLNQKYENIQQLTHDFEDHDELMEDSQIAEQMRVETIRSLPQSLTVKKEIRSNLNKTVVRRSSSNTGDFWRTCKDFSKLFFQNLQKRIEHTGNRFEIWYKSLKTIEGHFGSSVGAYFRFLQFLVIINALVAIFLIR